MRILGIDLAWGERKPDGLALLDAAAPGEVTLWKAASVVGDENLLSSVRELVDDGPALLALDGPIICRNETGARPVDREMHCIFGRAHAGCHPANLSRCSRPNRIRKELEAMRFRADHHMRNPQQLFEAEGDPLRRQIEVYPHPATLSLFGLRRIIKYKRGRVAERARQLAYFHQLLRRTLPQVVPPVHIDRSAGELFEQDPTRLVGEARKRHEDMLDAIVCAVVGWIHWWYGGRLSRVVGDSETGFIVIPMDHCPAGDAWTIW